MPKFIYEMDPCRVSSVGSVALQGLVKPSSNLSKSITILIKFHLIFRTKLTEVIQWNAKIRTSLDCRHSVYQTSLDELSQPILYTTLYSRSNYNYFASKHIYSMRLLRLLCNHGKLRRLNQLRPKFCLKSDLNCLLVDIFVIILGILCN